MKKRNRIIYWVATIWLCLGMLSSGIVQLIKIETEVDYILKMGYPLHLLTLLGLWKLLGVIAVLIPRFPILKEWAYAGFFFNMTGAVFAHLAVGSPATDIFPPLFLLVLTFVSYFFRPESRRAVSFKASILTE